MSVRLLMKAKIAAIEDVAEGIRVFEFHPADRDRFPSYPAGSHVVLRLRKGLSRQYSLCGPSSNGETYRIAVKLESQGRGGSAHLHVDNIRSGDHLFLSYPQPDFSLKPEDGSLLLIAGGIGITPIISFAYEACRQGRAVSVHYCVASMEQAIFLDELRALPLDLHIHDSSAGSRADFARILGQPVEGQGVYCCGSQRLMSAVADAARHWPQDMVHFEAFAPLDRTSQDTFGERFVADLPRSKHVLDVPADRTLLHVLLEDGVDLDFSCEAGFCRSCIVDILEGEIDHRDTCLTPEERKTMMTPCVSRGRGRIVIASL